MTTLDRVETQKLFDAINTRMAFMPMWLDSSSDILWFFRLPNPLASKEFRDKDKNLWKINPWDILVSIEAGINKAWVWDWKEPTHAMTYSINYSIYWVVRNYRCKNWYESSYVHKYMYSRDIEDVVSKFITHLNSAPLAYFINISNQNFAKSFYLSRNTNN